MARHMISFFYYSFLVWVALNGFIISSTEVAEVEPNNQTQPFNRSSFPNGFIFGAGSAAYQIEGAANMDGRGPSIWDTFTREHPEKIADGSNGDVADDFYHRYMDDIVYMKKIGLDSFRFSISWSRLFPNGSGEVNPLGVEFYNSLINQLLSNGIKPFVTLLHFDTPQALEDEYGGLLSSKIVKDFKDYADLCFKTFGDRVKLWVTLNEPNLWSKLGYSDGIQPPGRCSNYVGNCLAGSSATEPYIVAHNLLLAHASAVKLYKDRYQADQKGQIGITIVSLWYEPKFQTNESHNAASRALDFLFGWFAHPVIFGDYPESMKSIVGDRLPKFNETESKLLEGSLDFLGLNYYTSYYVEPASGSAGNASYDEDWNVTITYKKNGKPICPPTPLNWLFFCPKGFYDLLLYVKDNYNNPPIIITENGYADASNSTMPINDALRDRMRISYIKSHLSNLLQAIKEGVNVKGYYIWSFLDVFEWNSGYTARFGLIFVDYKNNLMRYLKYSAYWLEQFLHE